MPHFQPVCRICDHQLHSVKDYLKHCRGHYNDRNARFYCCVPACIRTTYTYKGLVTHLNREHRDFECQSQKNMYRNVGVSVRCVLDFCQRKCVDLKEMLTHLKEHLSSGLKLCCPFKQCSGLFEKKSSFTSHISRCHRNYSVQDLNPKYITGENASTHCGNLDDHDGNGCDDLNGPNVTSVDIDMGSNSGHETLSSAEYTKYIALFLLKLQAKHMIADNTIQVIVDEMFYLQQCSLNHINAYIQSKMTADVNDEVFKNIVEDTVKGITNLGCSLTPKSDFNQVESPENGILRSQFLRKRYFHTKFNYVSPIEIVLEESDDDKKICCHYVPILKTLKAMCEHKSVQTHTITSQTTCSNDYLRDVHDGQVFKQNAFFSTNPDAIQIILFQDAFEVTNPLGSSKNKHKMLGVYFTIGNLNPKCRSQIDHIQLVLLCREKYVKKYTQEKIFDNLLEDLEVLETTGITLNNGRVVKGSILVIVGDNLGSHCIGGYVESFQANYYCRYCTLSKTDIAVGPANIVGELRTPESYKQAVQEVKDNDELASSCGIKFDSIFNSLTNFHVANPGLPPCLGHDLFEGVVNYDMAIFIAYLVEKGWFTLELLNKNVERFPLIGSDASNRPAPTVSKQKLGGQAVENWWFVRFFPLMVYGLIQDTSDAVWQLVVKLKETVEIVVSPVIHISDVAYLRVLIEEYIEDSSSLFEEHQLRPKHHFMSHCAWNILMFGPLIWLWTLRFESKHSYFKRCARLAQNWINITLTLTERHQLLQAYCFQGHIFPDDVVVDKGTIFHLDLYAMTIQESVKCLDTDAKQYTVTDEVCVFNTKYKKGMFLIVQIDNLSEEWTFARILLVLVYQNEVNFVVKLYKSAFVADYGIYKITDTDIYTSLQCVNYDDLLDYYPLCSYKVSGSKFITLKNKPKKLM